MDFLTKPLKGEYIVLRSNEVKEKVIGYLQSHTVSFQNKSFLKVVVRQPKEEDN